MKSQKLLEYMLADAGIRCGVDTTRDAKCVRERVENEGESFLTISLPDFGKAFLQALDRRSASLLFAGFRKKGKLPVFLGGLLDLIFDRCSGDLLAVPSVDAIYCIHCLCSVCKKVESDCTPAREEAAYRKFVEVEEELDSFSPGNTVEFNLFGIVADFIWGPVCKRVERQVCNLDLLGRHGPGATAERITGNRKYDIQTWPSRLETYFPADTMCLANWGWVETLRRVEFLEPEAEIPVRVVSVPKTLKAPRIIAIEPVAMQFCQQAVLDVLRPAIETHRYTSGQINFSDQSVNATLALAASKHRNLATLDLTDASDRVSCALVYRMLHCVPNLRGAVFACRSTRADIPGYGVKTLSKYASMGSALCFEMEAMVFYTAVVASLLAHKSLAPTAANIKSQLSLVYVYGDDIIFPTDAASSTVSFLEALCLKVNRNKTFTRGNFRESCGMDAYDGERVTPIYQRKHAPHGRQDVSSIVSWTQLSNQLHAGGFWKSADAVRRVVERALGQELPLGLASAGGLVLTSFQQGQRVDGWCKETHTYKTRAFCIKSKIPPSRASSHGSLMKCLGRRSSVPFKDPLHLERSGRPLQLRLSGGWIRHGYDVWANAQVGRKYILLRCREDNRSGF